MIGLPEYELPKFLDSLIRPYIPDTYIIRFSQEFVETLKNFQFKPNHKPESFYVKSLFTNLSQEETIDIIANTISSDDTNILPIPISKEVFKKLMIMATQGIFMYNDKLYKQVDGVAMGSPLGPTIANFFLAHLETVLLKNKSKSSPALYSRCENDIFAIFEDKQDCFIFLNLLNEQLSNIAFTVEKSINSLPLLDIEIIYNERRQFRIISLEKTYTNQTSFKLSCSLSFKMEIRIIYLPPEPH